LFLFAWVAFSNFGVNVNNALACTIGSVGNPQACKSGS
jgi:hypothetical protein